MRPPARLVIVRPDRLPPSVANDARPESLATCRPECRRYAVTPAFQPAGSETFVSRVPRLARPGRRTGGNGWLENLPTCRQECRRYATIISGWARPEFFPPAATLLNPNSEIGLGSTGDQPVPSGHWPDGTGSGTFCSNVQNCSTRPSLPRGWSPRGTGRLPVLPPAAVHALMSQCLMDWSWWRSATNWRTSPWRSGRLRAGFSS